MQRGARSWTDEQMADAVAGSVCYADVMRALGLVSGGSGYRVLQGTIERLSLDTSHWTPADRKPFAERKSSSRSVTRWRRKAKSALVEEHGGRCLDCLVEYPPYVLQFDHRDPLTKEFGISGTSTKSIAKLRAEAAKCDLVCANCHAERTHRQWCDGCEQCDHASEAQPG